MKLTLSTRVAVAGVMLVASTAWGEVEFFVQRHPVTSNSLRGVASNGDVSVAVGDRGTILTSRDRNVWVRQDGQTTNLLFRVASGNGAFVAVGNHGLIITSTNGGLDWVSQRVEDVDQDFRGVTYGNGRFVATSSSGKVAVSTSGLEWQLRNTGARVVLFGIAFGEGLFVAAGSYDRQAGARLMLTSPDGIDWTVHPAPGNSDLLGGVAFSEGLFVAVGMGENIRSTDAINWTLLPDPVPPFVWRDICSSPIGFLAVGSRNDRGVTMTSADGLQWAQEPLNGSSFLFLYGVAYAAPDYITVDSKGSVWKSPNAKQWAPTPPSSRSVLFGVAASDDLILAVGSSGTILTSPDGGLWTEQVTGMTNWLIDVAYGKGTWVIGGGGAIILTSRDALNWTHQIISNVFFTSVTYESNKFVAVGWSDQTSASGEPGPTGVIWSSEDGLTGETDRGFFRPLADVIYSPEKRAFLAIGDGILVQSTSSLEYPNGWSQSATHGAGELKTIAFGNGLYVAASYNGIFASTNAIDWAEVPIPNGFSPSRVAFFENFFWAAGVFNDGSGYLVGEILRSQDGMGWTRMLDVTTAPLQQIAVVRNGLMAAGENGTILQSGSAAMPPQFRGWESRVLLDGSFAATVDIVPGAPVLIQSSSDLKTWSDLQKVTNRFGRAEVIDSTTNSPGSGFHRAVKVP